MTSALAADRLANISLRSKKEQVWLKVYYLENVGKFIYFTVSIKTL